jgi:hypothetical protein
MHRKTIFHETRRVGKMIFYILVAVTVIVIIMMINVESGVIKETSDTEDFLSSDDLDDMENCCRDWDD